MMNWKQALIAGSLALTNPQNGLSQTNENGEPTTEKIEQVAAQQQQESADTLSLAHPDAMTESEIEQAFRDAQKIEIKVYGGLNTNTSYNTETENTVSNLNPRAGVGVKLPVTNRMNLNAFETLNANLQKGDASFFQLNTIGSEVNVSDKFQIHAGKIATPTTLNHRLAPNSVGGQTESNTQSTVPGIAQGVSGRIDLSTDKHNGHIAGGMFSRNGSNEYHLAGSYKGVAASVWKNQGQDNLGAALTITHNDLSFTSVFNNDMLSNDTEYMFDQKNKLGAFTDITYNPSNGSFTNLETGINKHITKDGLEGIAICSYNAATKTMQIGLILGGSRPINIQ